MARLCQCCQEADISHRPPRTLYCLACRNSGRVLLMPTRARAFTAQLVSAGVIPRADSLACKDCGQPASEYDHRDYAKPWEVEAVCPACNTKRGAGANRFPWLPQPGETQAA